MEKIKIRMPLQISKLDSGFLVQETVTITDFGSLFAKTREDSKSFAFCTFDEMSKWLKEVLTQSGGDSDSK